MTEGDVFKLYRKEVFGIIDEIYNTEEKNILKAARMVADHVKKDKIVYVFGPGGHSNLAAMEVFFRAGGLMHINAILRNNAFKRRFKIDGCRAASRLRENRNR